MVVTEEIQNEIIVGHEELKLSRRFYIVSASRSPPGLFISCFSVSLQLKSVRHPSIKLEVTKVGREDGERVPFLDLDVFLQSGIKRFQYTMYRKPLSLYLYLPTTSSHPGHVFRGLVRGIRKRILRRCQGKEGQEKELLLSASHLRQRGYSMNFLKKHLMANVRNEKKSINTGKLHLGLMFDKRNKAKKIRRILREVVPDVNFFNRVQRSRFQRFYRDTWK